MCVDYLTAILVRLTVRRFESRYRTQDGELRVLTRGPTFAGLVGESFNQIRQNTGGNVAVLSRLLWSLETVADRTSRTTRRHALLGHARALEELCQRSICAPCDRQPLASRSARIISLLERGEQS